MRYMGIDPGPTGFAWAVYDDEAIVGAFRGGITEWGHENGVTPGSVSGSTLLHWKDVCGKADVVAVERIMPFGQPPSVGLLQTVEVVGMLRAMVPEILLIPRKSVVVALTGKVTHGDTEVNATMKRLCPNLEGRQPGLDGHVRAAAAVAYVAVGKWKAREVLKGIPF